MRLECDGIMMKSIDDYSLTDTHTQTPKPHFKDEDRETHKRGDLTRSNDENNGSVDHQHELTHVHWGNPARNHVDSEGYEVEGTYPVISEDAACSPGGIEGSEDSSRRHCDLKRVESQDNVESTSSSSDVVTVRHDIGDVLDLEDSDNDIDDSWRGVLKTPLKRLKRTSPLANQIIVTSNRQSRGGTSLREERRDEGRGRRPRSSSSFSGKVALQSESDGEDSEMKLVDRKKPKAVKSLMRESTDDRIANRDKAVDRSTDMSRSRVQEHHKGRSVEISLLRSSDSDDSMDEDFEMPSSTTKSRSTLKSLGNRSHRVVSKSCGDTTALTEVRVKTCVHAASLMIFSSQRLTMLCYLSSTG